MLMIKYIGQTAMYSVDFDLVAPNIIKLQGDFPICESGFVLSRPGMDDNWEYPDFKTVYKQVDGGVMFSNDGSVYVAPPEPEPIPDPEPYEPTPEELAAIFAQNKKDKILLSKSLLAAYLEEHPITSTAHGGVTGIYSVTDEKQSLMMRQYMTHQIDKSMNPDAKLRWNESGKSCQDWEDEEFLQLVMEIKAYVYPLVSYQQTLEEQITACTTQEQLDNIVIDYVSVAEREGE